MLLSLQIQIQVHERLLSSSVLMGKLLLTIGLIGLIHAAYSATQHRNYIRLTSAESASGTAWLPLDILIQTLLSLILTCIALVPLVARFRPIRIASDWESRSWFNIGNRVSFYSFNHRGKHLSVHQEPVYEQEEEVAVEEDDQEEEEEGLVSGQE